MTRHEPAPKPRQPRGRIDDMMCDTLTAIREGHDNHPDWQLLAIAERMKTIDGDLHDSVAEHLATLRGDPDPKQRRDAENNITKAIMALEGWVGSKRKKGAMTVSQMYAAAQAYGGMTFCQFLERAGVCEQSVTIEGAIAADDRFNEAGKKRLVEFVAYLASDPALTEKPARMTTRKRRKPPA